MSMVKSTSPLDSGLLYLFLAANQRQIRTVTATRKSPTKHQNQGYQALGPWDIHPAHILKHYQDQHNLMLCKWFFLMFFNGPNTTFTIHWMCLKMGHTLQTRKSHMENHYQLVFPLDLCIGFPPALSDKPK